jgi:hypothetical protein
LGSFEKYKNALLAMVGLYAPVEQARVSLSTASNEGTEEGAYLTNVQSSQATLVAKLGDSQGKKVKALNDTLAQIEGLEASRTKSADTLSKAFDKLKINVREAPGLTGADFCNLFSQLSFTNRDFTDKAGKVLLGGVAAAGSMFVSQLGDMTVKAMEDVATDTGNSLNKNYVIRRLEFLGKDIKDIGGLKQTRDGLLKTDPEAEHRLRATREQVENICSNFYESYPAAKAISESLDDYIEAVEARNEKVEEYNQLLADLAYVRAALNKAQEQKDQVDTAVQQSANPGLLAMAKFSRALSRHAWETCVENLYAASRVYTLESLNLYDVFVDVLGGLTDPKTGDLMWSALATGLIDLIGKKLNETQSGTNCEIFGPDPDTGKHLPVSWMLTPQKDPLVFAMLKGYKPGKFRILPADPQTTIDRNPFAGMADVRLNRIRCTANGMKTTPSNLHVITIRHPGQEAFVKEDGLKIQLNHIETKHECRYDAQTGTFPGGGELDQDHKMIGPFCEWEITIDKTLNMNLDLTGLESINIEFEGTYRAFR